MTAAVSHAAAAAAAAARAATHHPLPPAASFQPRQVFPVSRNIPASYFLGHHRTALTRMQRSLADVGLVLECRDFRAPLTSWNPVLERALASGERERARIVVYTKRDLGPQGAAGREVARRLETFHREKGGAAGVVFLGRGGAADGGREGGEGIRALLAAVKRVAREADSLIGLRALVVGMPNAGKSTLLNRLRTAGMGLGLAKAARTGAQPGVTRRLATPVRVVAADAEGGIEEGVFVVDTPGVFVPFVPDREAMVKLALVGCVKDGLVPAVTVADYLLFHANLVDPGLYAKYCPPTNEVHEFLAAVARRTGKLAKGGEPNLEAAADWIVQEWRKGEMGRFVLDDVTTEAMDQAIKTAAEPSMSMNQARKKEKEARKARSLAKHLGISQSDAPP